MDYTDKLTELKGAVKGLLLIYITNMYDGYKKLEDRMKLHEGIKLNEFNNVYDANNIDTYIGNNTMDINNLYNLIKYYVDNKENKDKKDKLNQIKQLFEKGNNKEIYNSFTDNKDLDKLNEDDINGLKDVIEMFKNTTLDTYKTNFEEKLDEYIKGKYDITKLKE